MAAFPVNLLKLKKTDCVFESVFQYNDGSHTEFMNLFQVDLSRYKCVKTPWYEFWDWDCHPQGNPLYTFRSHTVNASTPGTTFYAKVEVINEEEVDGCCLNLTFNCKVWSRSAINPVSPVSGGGKGKFWIGGVAVNFGEAPDLSLDFILQVCCKDIDDAPKEQVHPPENMPEGTTGHTAPRPEFREVDKDSGCYKECKIIAPASLI